MRAAVSTVERTAATPARCPATRGMWRRFAQRPLPSMMIAMCLGSRRRIQPPVNFGFLAIQPRGYFVLQSGLPKEANTEGKGGNDTMASMRTPQM